MPSKDLDRFAETTEAQGFTDVAEEASARTVSDRTVQTRERINYLPSNPLVGDHERGDSDVFLLVGHYDSTKINAKPTI